jgi:NAD(P)-dependent dehydrogenase (short-subunit alcohol dehydrogenase family)
MSEHVVLITGARTGIGRATATAFGRDGASTLLTAWRA